MEEENIILNVSEEENISSNIKDEILDDKKVTFLSDNTFKIGDKVEARFNEALHKWQPGIIIDTNSDDGKYLIEYHDGDSSRYVSPENIRLMPEKKEANIFKIGDIIEAKYRGRGIKWYKGKIIDIGRISGKYVIRYDDGDIEKDVLPENIRLLNDNYKEEIYPDNIYKVNDRVEARYGKRTRWYPGIITRADKNNKYSIQYDDGEYETFVSEEYIRFLIPYKLIFDLLNTFQLYLMNLKNLSNYQNNCP